MYVDGIGGLKVFSTEIFKEDKRLDVVYVYKNEFGVETNREKLELFFNDKYEIIEINSGKIDKLLKKQFSEILKVTQADSNLKKLKILSVETKKDLTNVSFSYNKEHYSISVEWDKVPDFMEIEAPSVEGEFILNSSFNNEVLKQFLMYAIKSGDEVSMVVSKMNLLLFFEALEQNRSMHIIQVLSGYSAFFDLIGKETFEKIYITEEIEIEEQGKVSVLLDGKINKYNLKFDYNFVIKVDNEVFVIVEDGILDEENLYSFFTEVNQKYFNDKFDIFEFNAKDTNKKNLLDLIVIENEENSFLYKKPEVNNFIANGLNLKINFDSLEIEEVYSVEEVLEELKVNILKAISFMKKNT